MRKAYLSSIVFILFAMLISSYKGNAAQPSNDLSVSFVGNKQSIQMFDISERRNFDVAIQVTNVSNSIVNYSVYPSDQITAENGGWAFYEDGRKNTLSGTWFSIHGPSNVEIKPGQVKEHKFTISIPSHLDDGQYVAAVVVRQVQKPKAIEQAQGENLVISPELATEKFIQFVFNKNIKNSRHAMKVVPQEMGFDSKGVPQFKLILKNEGTILEKPKGHIKIEDESQQLIQEFDFQMGSVYPGTEGALVRAIDHYFKAGKYKVIYDIQYGSFSLNGSYGIEISNEASQQSLENMAFNNKVVVNEDNKTLIYLLVGVLCLLLSVVIVLLLKRTRGASPQKEEVELPQ